MGAKAKKKPFTMVRRSLWDSKRFGGLPDDKTRYLYLYFLTSRHQTGSGCFLAKSDYVLADLRLCGADWTEEALAAGIRQLVEAQLILADAETQEILILNWWKDNPPSNESWFAGVKSQCDTIESAELREAVLLSLSDCMDAFRKAKGIAAVSSVPVRAGGGRPLSLTEINSGRPA